MVRCGALRGGRRGGLARRGGAGRGHPGGAPAGRTRRQGHPRLHPSRSAARCAAPPLAAVIKIHVPPGGLQPQRPRHHQLHRHLRHDLHRRRRRDHAFPISLERRQLRDTGAGSKYHLGADDDKPEGGCGRLLR